MDFIQRKNIGFSFIGIAIAVSILIQGCAGATLKRKNPASGGLTRKTERADTEKKTGPLYRDFEDVLVPSELKVDTQSTFIYQTSGLTAGILALTGRVEVNSLATFFENNMTKDNWKLLSSFKSSRTILLFQKVNRWCVIYITDKDFKIDVEIWVSPTMGVAEQGLMK